ncbi:GAF domain-containing protein [Bowmanella sp. Y26]|uniref:GAF domain-containing protein n=1 Tax=Bowmanella yangjiangensis TaxID=2811230 RepID=UPI001BDC4FDA|nr:GAF domain-containing protein [Bowmanella yangjiangensis]MBT1064105.1 GAF domain-containing protein [Bowmanella yangjiangensis]
MLALSTESMSALTKEQLLTIIEAQTDIIGSKASLSEVMQKMATLAEQLTFASGAVVEILDGEEMVYRAATGKAKDRLGMRLHKDKSLSGLCIKENRLLNCQDAMNDPRVDKEACQKVGLNSMLVVPLNHQQDVVGVIKVFSTTTDAFDDVDGQILMLAAQIISAAIHASIKPQH